MTHPAQFRQSPVLMAGIITLAVGFPVCSSHGTEKQVVELRAQIAALEAQLGEKGTEGAEVIKLRENVSKYQAEIGELKDSLPAVEERIAEKEKLLPLYQMGFRTVTKFSPGQALSGFTLKNGITVEPSSFIGTVKGGISIQSATGSRTIELGQLPDSFADQVLLPPPAPSLPGTLAAIKGSKPDNLKTDEDRKQAKMVAAADSNPAGSAALPETSTTPAAASAPASDLDGVRQRNERRQREIAELKLQFSDLFSQKKRARDAKAADERLFREAKIKKSQSEITTTIRMHEQKIAAIEQQEVELRARISRLQLEFE